MRLSGALPWSMLAYIPRRTTIIETTPTLLAGQEATKLLKILNLAPGNVFFQRRSNRRFDVQDIIHVLRHGLSGAHFQIWTGLSMAQERLLYTVRTTQCVFESVSILIALQISYNSVG